jgi:type VI secretion system ImpM family protein
MRAFDEWIRQGLSRVRNGRGPEGGEAYDNALTVRFFLSLRNRQVPNALLGVIQASRDRSGRAYPFAVTCELPKSAVRSNRLANLPLQAASFYSAAEQVVRDATEGTLSYHEVTDRVTEITPSFFSSPSPSAYDQFVRQQTVGNVLGTVFDDFEDGGKYRVFKNLLDIFLPQRKRDTPRLNYGIQFPLGEGEASPTKTACFWLDTSLHLLDHPDAECSFFWTSQRSTSTPSFFLLFLGSPRADAFFHLLSANGQTENICELGRMGRMNNTEAALSLPNEYGSLLEDDQLPLRDFLQRL